MKRHFGPWFILAAPLIAAYVLAAAPASPTTPPAVIVPALLATTLPPGPTATPLGPIAPVISPTQLLSHLPILPQPPKTLWVPQEITFTTPSGTCPPQGGQPGKPNDAPETNLLKNRIDEPANYYPVTFSAIMTPTLAWPRGIGNHNDRSTWPLADMAAVEKYEGLPVAVEGYLFYTSEPGKAYGAEQQEPETTNCKLPGGENKDFHIWLVKAAGDANPKNSPPRDVLVSGAVVVEATPRVRVQHPKWTTGNLRRLALHHTRVRISGWLFLDPEHPENVDGGNGGQGKASITRGTIWEIHPIMQIEVQKKNGQWVTLDADPDSEPVTVPMNKLCQLLRGSVTALCRRP